jgi:hypothetical protein
MQLRSIARPSMDEVLKELQIRDAELHATLKDLGHDLITVIEDAESEKGRKDGDVRGPSLLLGSEINTISQSHLYYYDS